MALHEMDFHPDGFEWVDCSDSEGSTCSLLRKGSTTGEILLIALNFTPVPRSNYRVGVPWGGYWKEILNSDYSEYGGSGYGNLGGVEASPISFHGRSCSLNLTLPPLGALFFKREGNRK